jgi:large subunit ribosomal protein L24
MFVTELKGPRVSLKKGDIVKVISGKEKGKQGKILQILTKEQRVLVEKLNLIKKHQKPSQDNKQGGIVEKEASMHISNVMLICNHCNKNTRFKIKVLEDNKKIRICAKCGEGIDRV